MIDVDPQTFREAQMAARAAEGALIRWRRTLKPAAAEEAIEALQQGMERVRRG